MAKLHDGNLLIQLLLDEADELLLGVNAQLAIDAEHVRLDRIAAHDKLLFDICRIPPSRKQEQDIGLA